MFLVSEVPLDRARLAGGTAATKAFRSCTGLPRALNYAYGPMVLLGRGAVSYERGTPVGRHCHLDSLLVGPVQGYLSHKKTLPPLGLL